MNMDIKVEIDRAAKVGQKLEDLVSGKSVTITTNRDALLIGFWSLIFDYSKGMMLLLSSQFYASAFAQWRPLVEASIRSHLVLMVSDEDFERIRKDDYRVNFKEDAKRIDGAFGLGQLFQNFLAPDATDALHSFTHSGIVPLRRRFDGKDVVANYPDKELLALINTTTSCVYMVTNLVTKHFKLEQESKLASDLFEEWSRASIEAPPPEIEVA
jgi:hypothetical protein